MILETMIFDVPLGGGDFVVFGGITFFFVLVAVGFIAYKMMRKTFKMAVRMAVVVAILAIAFAGSIAFLWLASVARNRPGRPIPTASKPR